MPGTSSIEPLPAKEAGFIYACELDGRGGARQLGPGEMELPGSDDAPRWLHLRYTDADVITWLRDSSGLPEVIINALTDDDVRPRILVHEDGLLLVLRGVNCNPGADPEDMVALRIWVERGRVITTRHRKVLSIDDINRALLSGRGPRSLSQFVSAACTLLTDRIASVVSDLVDRADELEDEALSMKSHELRGELAGLRRQAIALRRYIAPQRDVLSKLFMQDLAWAGPDFSTHVREQAEATSRLVEDLDAARERAAITHEELNSRIAEGMNRTMYLLSIVAAIFLPLGFLTGLLGINVGGIPGGDNDRAFAVVCAVLAAVAVLQLLYFRARKFL